MTKQTTKQIIAKIKRAGLQAIKDAAKIENAWKLDLSDAAVAKLEERIEKNDAICDALRAELCESLGIVLGDYDVPGLTSDQYDAHKDLFASFGDAAHLVGNGDWC